MTTVVTEVNYDLKRPCNDCPFMKTAKFHEGVADSLPDYLDSIKAGTFSHTCHKTDNREAVDGPKNCTGPVQHCLGSILMLLKTSNKARSNYGRGLWNQSGIVHGLKSGKISDERFGRLSKQANENPKVFTLLELMDFYLKKISQLARKRAHEES